MNILDNDCKVRFRFHGKETAEKLLRHCNEMLNSDLDVELELMYRLIRSDVDKYLQQFYE